MEAAEEEWIRGLIMIRDLTWNEQVRRISGRKAGMPNVFREERNRCAELQNFIK